MALVEQPDEFKDRFDKDEPTDYPCDKCSSKLNALAVIGVKDEDKKIEILEYIIENEDEPNKEE